MDTIVTARLLLALFAAVATGGAYLAVRPFRRRSVAVAVAVGTLVVLGALFVAVDVFLLRQM